MLRTFLNACKTYFKLGGSLYENTKAQFFKTLLSDTAHTWYNSQGYDKITATFETIKSHILDYFIPLNYIKRARRALVTCNMG